MTHLNIQQGLNVEIVSTQIIRKLHEIAQSVPLPEEGEQDLAYMSGNLLVAKSYRVLVEYLTNRFDDLHINVTDGYYIPFYDSAVNNALKNTIGDGVGVLDTLMSAVTNLNDLGLSGNTDITDFREAVYLDNPSVYIQGNYLSGCTNLRVVGMPPNLLNYPRAVFYNTNNIEKIVIKNLYKFLSTTFEDLVIGGPFANTHDICEIDNSGNLTILKNVTVPAFANANWSSAGFWSSTVEEATFDSDVTWIGLFGYSTIRTLNFPQDSQITTIRRNAFYRCKNLQLDVSTLPSTITTIEIFAFAESSKNVTGELNLPNLTTLEELTFTGCGLTKITNLGQITKIGHRTFLGNNLTSVTLPSTVTDLGYVSVFYDNPNLTTITGLLNVTKFGDYCFYVTNLTTNVSLLSNAVTIGQFAFNGLSHLTGTLDMPNLISIGNNAFQLTGITSITDLGTINAIPTETFMNCTSLTSITLPSGVLDLSARCFKGCTSLNYLVCPRGLYWGSEDGFNGCSALNKIQINDLESWYTNSSNRYDNGFPLTCNNLTKQLYDSNGNHITNLVLPEGITTCSNLNSGRTCKAFNRTDITSVTLPSTITELGGFTNCTSLASIDFSNASSLTTFLQNAFIGCTSLNLDLANLPNSITSLGWNSFGNNPLVHGDINLPNLIGGLGLFVSYIDGNMGIISFSNLGNITTIITDALRGLVGKVKFIVLPSTLTSFSGRNFKVNQYMLCLATTPPTQGEYGWDANNIPYCFVPDASLSAYLSSSAWSSLNLHGMSEFSSLATLNNWDLPTT